MAKGLFKITIPENHLSGTDTFFVDKVMVFLHSPLFINYCNRLTGVQTNIKQSAVSGWKLKGNLGLTLT